MRLNGLTWLISGGIIAIMAGYVYLTIPKNGQPNMAMAIFFFIGIIFIVIGIAKLFFKRSDDQSMLDSLKTAEQSPKLNIMPNTLNNAPQQNRIDETISQMMQQEQTAQSRPQAPLQHNTPKHNSGHTNSYSKLYEYKGPVHTPSSSTHAQHPVTQHTQTHVQNTADHSMKCRKCGNANSGSANYCHSCGNRLK